MRTSADAAEANNAASAQQAARKGLRVMSPPSCLGRNGSVAGVYRRMLSCRKRLQNKIPHRGIPLGFPSGDAALDLDFTADERAFRDEVRAFLLAER